MLQHSLVSRRHHVRLLNLLFNSRSRSVHNSRIRQTDSRKVGLYGVESRAPPHAKGPEIPPSPRSVFVLIHSAQQATRTAQRVTACSDEVRGQASTAYTATYSQYLGGHCFSARQLDIPPAISDSSPMVTMWLGDFPSGLAV